jgi:ribonuclease HI
VDGYPCAKYKKLRTLEEAEAWMQRAVPYPIKQNINPANHSLGKSRTSIGSQRSGRVAASSSSSTVEVVAPGRSQSQSTVADPSSSRSHAAVGPSKMSAMAEDVVYTDGACSGNGQLGSVAGTGVWWGVDDPRNLSERCPGRQTNNRAELIVRLILETLRDPSDTW